MLFIIKLFMSILYTFIAALNVVMIHYVILVMLKKVRKVPLCFLGFILVFFIPFYVWEVSYKNIGGSENKIYSTNITWWKSESFGLSKIKTCANGIQCNVYSTPTSLDNIGAFLFYGSSINFNELPLPRLPHHIWGLYHEESPRNVEELMHEDVLKLFNYSSTFSRHSNIPFPLQYLGSLEDITSKEFFIDTKTKNVLLNETAPVLYLQSDCETSTQRDAYVRELMKFIEIDSYGTCLNNKKLSEKFTQDYLNNLNDKEFLKFVGKYKFVIAIENGVCTDYITEKFWRAIKVGTVPIYYGSPSIKDWLPNPKSALVLDDYPSPELMGQQIKKLMKNDNLYEEYLDHKIKQIITNHRLINELEIKPYQTNVLKTVEHFECFICAKLHALNKGERNISMVDKMHYDCPKPMTALSLSVDPLNDWVFSWEFAKSKVSTIVKAVEEKTLFL